MLPDFATNPEENYGFINYYIKQKPGLSVGTEITNTADIIFDYNLPIRTLEVKNTIVSPTGISEFGSSESIFVHPNPASDFLTIQFKNTFSVLYSLLIFDMKGKQVGLSYQINKENIIVNISSLPSGIYVLKASTPNGIFYNKIIKM